MVLLDRVQRSELRRAFLSEMRPLLDDADAALDDDEVLRVLFTRRASWLQQQRFSRTPYTKLTEAITSGRRRAVDEAMDQLPLPPTADLGRPLLEVIQRMDDDLALRAAELLATVRHGQGAVFLMEALLTPSLRVAPALIELLDFEVMGTAWIRLPTVLRALDSAPRQQLIQRLVDNHARVPAWRWESAVLACDAVHDMPLILRHFQSLMLRTLRQEHIEEVNPLQALRALSDALTRRLALTPDDPPLLQAAIAELLVEDAARDTTAARRLLQVLEQTTSASLRHVLLLQLLRRVDVLASHLVDESVAVLVHIAERRQEPFTSLALSCLRYLASLGNPIAWEPLLQCPGSEPRNVVMRALSRQESDISAALSDVLAAPDPAIRRSAASLIGRRLARGRAIRDEVLSAFAARIAQDPDGSVAQGLDVHTLFHFAPRKQQGPSRWPSSKPHTPRCSTAPLKPSVTTPSDSAFCRAAHPTRSAHTWPTSAPTRTANPAPDASTRCCACCQPPTCRPNTFWTHSNPYWPPSPSTALTSSPQNSPDSPSPYGKPNAPPTKRYAPNNLATPSLI